MKKKCEIWLRDWVPFAKVVLGDFGQLNSSDETKLESRKKYRMDIIYMEKYKTFLLSSKQIQWIITAQNGLKANLPTQVDNDVKVLIPILTIQTYKTDLSVEYLTRSSSKEFFS